MDFSVKSLAVGPIGVNCYILKDDSSNEGIVIDAGGNADKILSVINKEGIDVKMLVLTHGHFDHIGAVDELREELNVPLAVHEADAQMITDGRQNLSAFVGELMEKKSAEIILHDGDTVSFGRCSLKVISTPGHTPGGICLYGGGALFSGDTLFAGSVGRTDFPGSSTDDILDSVRNKLSEVSDDTEVFPGHGPATTMGIERKTNPYM